MMAENITLQTYCLLSLFCGEQVDGLVICSTFGVMHKKTRAVRGQCARLFECLTV